MSGWKVMLLLVKVHLLLTMANTKEEHLLKPVRSGQKRLDTMTAYSTETNYPTGDVDYLITKQMLEEFLVRR